MADIAPYATASARWFVGAVLLFAGIAKFRSLPTFTATVRAFGIIPGALSRPVSVAIPTIEVVLAALLLFGVALRASGAASAALLIAFGLAITWNLIRGRRVACGCFGSASERISELSVFRTSVLLILSSMIAWLADPYLTIGALWQHRSTSPPTADDAIPLGLVTAAGIAMFATLESVHNLRRNGVN